MAVECRDVINIAAVLLGPILAVQAQKFIENLRDAKERRVTIFKALMASRAQTISQKHVEALNLIELEFHGGKSRKVIDCWRIYLDNLNNGPRDEGASFQANLRSWSEKNADLLAALLKQMADSLGYDFDEVQLKRGAYSPVGHANVEREQAAIRKGLVDILSGHRSFPIMQGPTKDLDVVEKN